MKDRILVVDDDPSIRAILAGLLRKSYTIDTAATGEIALELAAREAPAVVLLDIMLPGIDGYETCRRLKSSLFDGKVQVIMISAASSQEEQFRAFEAGADAYMVKPVDANVLRSEVQLHLRLREAIGRLASIEAEIQSRRAELQRLVEDRERQIGATQDVAVFAIARVAESRDEETGEHVIRVRSYSRVLAEELAKSDRYRRQIDEQFLRDLYRSSPLHDIGKVAISDTILLKAGRLTAKEFELVKIHTIHGADILDAVVSHSQSGDLPGHGGCHRQAPPRVVQRDRISRRAGGRGDPSRREDRRRSRRLRRTHVPAAVQTGLSAGRRTPDHPRGIGLALRSGGRQGIRGLLHPLS